VLAAYEHWTRDLDERATTCVRLLRLPSLPELPEMLRGESFAVVDGAIDAPAADAERLLAPLRALGPAIDALLSLTGPGVQSPLLVVDLRHLGGAVSRPDPDGGAVSHLPGRFLAFAVGIAPTPRAAQAVEQAIGTLRTALAPWTIDRDYPNMREAAVPAARFYPPRTLSRLLAVQAAYDPDHVIRASHPLGGYSAAR